MTQVPAAADAEGSMSGMNGLLLQKPTADFEGFFEEPFVPGGRMILTVGMDDPPRLLHPETASRHAGKVLNRFFILIRIGRALRNGEGITLPLGHHGVIAAVGPIGIKGVDPIHEEFHLAGNTVHIDGAADDHAGAAFYRFQIRTQIVTLRAEPEMFPAAQASAASLQINIVEPHFRCLGAFRTGALKNCRNDRRCIPLIVRASIESQYLHPSFPSSIEQFVYSRPFLIASDHIIMRVEITEMIPYGNHTFSQKGCIATAGQV
jgi:hypothetical protein